MKRQSLLILLLLLLAQGAFAASRWLPRLFPSPLANPDQCGSDTRLCDPDGILTADDKNALLDAIAVFEDTHSVSCTTTHEKYDIQLAVALVNRMDLYEYREYEDMEKLAAQDFAIHVHNAWGVGVDSPCGGTGVLLFLSLYDRAIYISTGNAVKPLLTDHRLDKVMNDMKPLLRQVKYGDALQTAVHEIGRHVESGEPNRMERFWAWCCDLWPFAMFASIIGLVALQGRLQQRRQREYARVQTQLSELDRNRAEALQGRYQCQSCPICLSDFETPVSNDGQESNTDAPKIGSDGLPLQLLRCGHVFDQTCWTEWVENGQGNPSKCPICNQDVGALTDEASPEQNNEDVRQRGVGIPRGGGIVQEREPRALRRYNQDRMFRLARLGMQYPRFVNHQQVQRWSDPAYDRSLARDYSFTRNNPVQHTRYSGGSSRFGSGGSSRSSFGGGRSAGGRAGRW